MTNWKAGAQRAGRWPQKLMAHVVARAQCGLLKAHGWMARSCPD